MSLPSHLRLAHLTRIAHIHNPNQSEVKSKHQLHLINSVIIIIEIHRIHHPAF